jgi:hypothetical protein
MNEIIKPVDGDKFSVTAEAVSALIDNQVKAKPQTPQFYSPIGDSFTAAPSGMWSWFSHASKGQLILLNQHGVGGNRTDQILARLDDLDSRTTITTIMEVANDASQGVTPLQHATNVRDILLGCIDRKITPIWFLGSPKDNPAHADIISEYNIWDWLTCRSLGVICIQPWKGMSDGFGKWKSGLSIDGTHPKTLVHKTAGLQAWEDYDKLELADFLITNNNYGPVSNPLFMLETAGLPNDWNLSGAGGSLVESTELGEGNTWTFNCTAFRYSQRGTSLTAGKTYLVGMKHQTVYNSTDGSAKVEIYLQAPSGVRTYLTDEATADISNGLVSRLFTAEETGTYLISITCNGTAFDVDVSVAQYTQICIDDHTIPI